MLFFDEADGLLSNRNDAGPNGKKMVAQFLLEMDELKKSSQHQNNSNEQVVIIAATNSLEKVDLSFFRPGRLERRVKVGKLSSMEEIIQAFHSLSNGDERFSKINWNLFIKRNFDSIMKLNKNEGLTGALIGQILMRSTMECEKRMMELSMDIVEEQPRATVSLFVVDESDIMLALQQELSEL